MRQDSKLHQGNQNLLPLPPKKSVNTGAQVCICLYLLILDLQCQVKHLHQGHPHQTADWSDKVVQL